MDGYSSKLDEFQKLFDKQIQLNKDILEMSNEIKSLPEFPENVDAWIDSISDEKTKFKLSDYTKLFGINKRYNKVLEQREENSSKIKSSVIDILIDKIKAVLNE